MPKTPRYRRRANERAAIVTLTDSESGKRRDYRLGPFNSPESRERYHRVIAEWESLGRRLPEPDFDRPPAAAGADGGAGPSVKRMVLRFWRFASESFDRRHAETFRVALRLLCAMDGSTPAREYGPSRLRRLREAMIRGDAGGPRPRPGWSRRYTNSQVMRVRQVFRWAASHEIIPVSVPQALATVEALRRGRTSARETERVGPAPLDVVDAARPFLSRQARAVVDLQLLTGARPGELLGMRPIDIETDGRAGVWVFRPASHKNAHRGHERAVYLGPRAQELIGPFLAGRPVDRPLFSPAEAEAERRAARSAARTTPLCCGNRPGTNRRGSPRRRPGDAYTPASYLYAIYRACDAAFPPPARLARLRGEARRAWRARLTPAMRAELAAWRKSHRFHPYQLRHNAATAIRREFGLEAAQLALGHASAAITDAVYAERDEGRVAEVMRRVG